MAADKTTMDTIIGKMAEYHDSQPVAHSGSSLSRSLSQVNDKSSPETNEDNGGNSSVNFNGGDVSNRNSDDRDGAKDAVKIVQLATKRQVQKSMSLPASSFGSVAGNSNDNASIEKGNVGLVSQNKIHVYIKYIYTYI